MRCGKQPRVGEVRRTPPARVPRSLVVSSTAGASTRGGAGWGGHRGHASPQACGGTNQWALGYRVSTESFRRELGSRSSWGENPAVGMNMPREWQNERAYGRGAWRLHWAEKKEGLPRWREW